MYSTIKFQTQAPKVRLNELAFAYIQAFKQEGEDEAAAAEAEAKKDADAAALAAKTEKLNLAEKTGEKVSKTCCAIWGNCL